MTMRLRFCESEIEDLAIRYTEGQHEENREREETLIGLRERILRRGHPQQIRIIYGRALDIMRIWGGRSRNLQEATLTIS